MQEEADVGEGTAGASQPGDEGPLWTPSASRRDGSRLGRWCAAHGFTSYDDAWAWSVAPGTAGRFWEEMAAAAGVRWHHQPTAPLVADPGRATGARFFPGGRLNYAERALTAPEDAAGSVAVVARSQTRPPVDLTWAELRELVARVRGGLLAAGVGTGDRVAGYLPNVPEALATMLAAASLGAVWTCCAPEMGVTGVVDRLAQVAPTVLVSVDGYRYAERTIDRRAEAAAVRAALPSVSTAVWLGYLDPDGPVPDGWTAWSGFTEDPAPLDFVPVDFDHPLYVLYSSGTTGKPKPIVHGHGGILLEHAKALSLHFDLGPGDRFFWFTTTGWMMWNFCVSGLVVDAAVVLFDGDPSWPSPDALWALTASTGVTCGGVGAAYLAAEAKAGRTPGADHDLSALRTLGATGSPLPAAAARWCYEAVGKDLLLASFSGGTDVCTGFVGASPLHPVWAGEISCRCLGAKVEVFDDAGHPLVGREGELVLTAPLPSMPVGFFGDGDGSRYRAAYFERFPGVWAHGDRATLTERGTVVITGRSDGTLNRGGVRMGTAEFYSVVERFPEVADSLVVHLEDEAGGAGELWLFLVETSREPTDGPADGSADTAPVGAPAAAAAALVDRVRAALRAELSPRHVPDRIVTVAGIPRTLSGKKLEVPVKRLLLGVPVDEALSRAAVADPEHLEPFVSLGRTRRSSSGPAPAPPGG